MYVNLTLSVLIVLICISIYFCAGHLLSVYTTHYSAVKDEKGMGKEERELTLAHVITIMQLMHGLQLVSVIVGTLYSFLLALIVRALYVISGF